MQTSYFFAVSLDSIMEFLEMARFDDNMISLIKSEVGLLPLIKEQGYSFKKQGCDYVMSCPFHNDRTPSCVITPSKNLWHCMGACSEGGSVIDWLMKTDKLAFREAVEQLAKRLPGGIALETQSRASSKPAAITAMADEQQLLKTVFGHYGQSLKHSDAGLAYLEKRGLKDPALIEYFKLGLADQSLMRRLPSRDTKDGIAVRDQLKGLGVIRSSGHEYFKGSLVVPVLDGEGNIQQAYGRKLLEKSRNNPNVHRYLPGPHETVWHSEAVKGTKEIILCESIIDAMTFWINGFKHVLTSYGINGFTEAHLHLLLPHKIERVLIAYDCDQAGNTAAIALAEQLQSHGIACFRLQFPKQMDANEYACTVKPPHKTLGLVISKAVYMGEGDAPSITSLHDQSVVLDEMDLLVNREVMQAAEKAPNRIKTAAKEKSEPEPDPVSVTPTDSEAATSSSLAAVAADTDIIANAENNPVAENPINIVSNASSQSKSVSDNNIEVTDKEITIHYETRRYRVRGLQKNQTYDCLKINLLASEGDNCFVDNLDLYAAKQRGFFIKQAALELAQDESTVKRDIGKLLLTLEELQLKQIDSTLSLTEQSVILSPEEEKEALAFLQSPQLLQQIIDDFNSCGVVGEEINTLTGYLAVTSRQLNKPLAVVIQSSSAAGKSSLMDAVLAFMPEESRVQFSAMSAQSLFYMGQTNLRHKVLAISEEEGAHSASYALKLLQSEGEITMASTGKNPNTGQLETQSYKVEGPVMLFFTTTAIDVDEELLNRCLVLTVNESREQTEAIHSIQREAQTLEGMLLNHSKQGLIRKHRNAQRLLKPIKVVNPFAHQLTFLSDKTRTRRDHMKYLQLINAVTFLHQYQREVKTIKHDGQGWSSVAGAGCAGATQGEWLEYIEATVDDIAIANELAHAILGRSLDELPPQTRRLLELTYDMVHSACRAEKLDQSAYRFSRRDIRQFTGWSDGQLKIHCKRLEEMEYLLVHKGRRGQSIQYELLYSGQLTDDENQLYGLIDTRQLGSKANIPASLTKKSGQKSKKSAPSQCQVRPKSGGGQASINAQNTINTVLNSVLDETGLKNTYREKINPQSLNA